MIRKYFETINQKVVTKVVLLQDRYFAVHLPSNFAGEKVELWSPSRKVGQHRQAFKSGGSAMVSLPNSIFMAGEILTASFNVDMDTAVENIQ